MGGGVDPILSVRLGVGLLLGCLQQRCQSRTHMQNASCTVHLPTENSLQQTMQTGHPFCLSVEAGRKNASLSLHDAFGLRPSV